MNIHVDGNGLSHIFWIGVSGQKGVQKLFFSGGVGNRDAREVTYLTEHLVAIPQVLLGGSSGEVRVVDHTGDLQPRVGLHTLL